MHILLKDLLKEEEDKNPLQVQLYCDMDGVLVDMEAGFKDLSGGLSPKDYEAKNGKNSFWKLIGTNPNFWIDLEPMPDAKILWDFIRENFKNPPPIILSAGDRRKEKKPLTAEEVKITERLVTQKTQWIRNFTGDASLKVIIAGKGINKPNEIKATAGRVTYILLDDTPENISSWDNVAVHRVGIHHINAASSIVKLKSFIEK